MQDSGLRIIRNRWTRAGLSMRLTTAGRNRSSSGASRRGSGSPFTLDVAAAPHNAKCARFYTRQDDGLVQSWAGERVWCNPPYSKLGDWLAKAWAEYPHTRGIVMLLPANRVEQKWWQEHVEPFRDREGSPLRVEFLPGRMRFIRPNAVISPKGDRPPFGCCLLIWGKP